MFGRLVGQMARRRNTFRLAGPCAFIVALPFLAVGVGAGAAAESLPGTVTNYPATIRRPSGIAAGPDGAMWFTNYGNNSIGRITTAGTVTNYTGTGIDGPFGIAAGPDGALWFTSTANRSIGRITTAGTVTVYSGTGIDYPGGVTAGPDGALWFTNRGNNSIGRITPAGTVTNYTGPEIDPDGIA